MYFTYLRGKQFELIAVRELIENGLINNKVIPVIEPIKPTATLLKLLETCRQHDKNIAIITNPKVGNFIEEYQSLNDDNYKKEYVKHLDSTYITASHIINSNTTSDIENLVQKNFQKKDLLLVHNRTKFIKEYQENLNFDSTMYNLVPYDIQFKRNIKTNKILLADRFPKQERNVDYLYEEDRYFSEDHLFYNEEGYKGFSDFSIVGSEFIESGFAP